MRGSKRRSDSSAWDDALIEVAGGAGGQGEGLVRCAFNGPVLAVGENPSHFGGDSAGLTTEEDALPCGEAPVQRIVDGCR